MKQASPPEYCMHCTCHKMDLHMHSRFPTNLQQDQSVTVVKIFPISHYLSWGSSSFLLPGCNHFFIRCINCPIPLRWALPSTAAPLFPNTSCLAMWSQRWGARCLSHSSVSIVGKLWGGSLPDRFYNALGFSSAFPLYQEESSLTEEEPSLSLVLTWLQSLTLVKGQLEQ